MSYCTRLYASLFYRLKRSPDNGRKEKCPQDALYFAVCNCELFTLGSLCDVWTRFPKCPEFLTFNVNVRINGSSSYILSFIDTLHNLEQAIHFLDHEYGQKRLYSN